MKKLILILAIVFLSACHSGRFTYTFISPPTPMGKYCISKCLEKKNACMQLCQVKIDHCKIQEQESAYYRYQMYHDDQVAKGKRVKRFITDFNRSPFICCQSLCHCDADYRTCYVDCGGIIERHLR